MAEPERLRRRADFLRAAKGKRFYAHGLTLQAVQRLTSASVNSRASRDPNTASGGARSVPIDPIRDTHPSTEAPPRFGFTVTKQLGGAVRRNRIRRRLKEALRLLKPLPARPGHDYVILARPEALGMSFRTLQTELKRALGKIDIDKNSSPLRLEHGGNSPISGVESGTRQKRSKVRTHKG